MVRLTVNGQSVQCQEEKNLLRFLRDDLGITSAKDGCSEGACGTCTVLVDGKAVRACVQKMSRLEGKQVVTVEGLSEREKAVHEYCFAAAGAVQCGFCIPGMVICAKGLLDVEPVDISDRDCEMDVDDRSDYAAVREYLSQFTLVKQDTYPYNL